MSKNANDIEEDGVGGTNTAPAADLKRSLRIFTDAGAERRMPMPAMITHCQTDLPKPLFSGLSTVLIRHPMPLEILSYFLACGINQPRPVPCLVPARGGGLASAGLDLGKAHALKTLCGT